MAKKVCAEPGCPTLTDTTRCVAHTRTRDQARGTRQQRGYDKGHQRRRAKQQKAHAQGSLTCWRCGTRISPLQPFDLGHCDDDRTVTHGPECISCNRGARGACTHVSHADIPPRA